MSMRSFISLLPSMVFVKAWKSEKMDNFHQPLMGGGNKLKFVPFHKINLNLGKLARLSPVCCVLQ